MGNVTTQGQTGNKNQLTISDLTSKYQQKIDNYNLMVGLMTEEQKKVFQIAINMYDIQIRQNHWDSYVGYALKALAMKGWYYNVLTQQWMPCQTPETFVKADPKKSDQRAYEEYLETLYSRQSCQLLGISCWEIIDRDVDMNAINLAMGGEMQYEEYDLTFNVEHYEVGGEQKKANTPNKITHPDIPISPNINVAELTKGDSSKDKFIYAYTDSGLSKNKRNWRPMIMDRIAQQVMDQNPPGNMGHVNPKNVGYELPLPVITWIGATTVLLPDGVKRLWLKGYIIPTADGANLKTYIRAKAINSISVYGGLTLLPNAETGTQDVLDIDLKSIDISGKLKEGLNSGITELAGEMANPNQTSMQYNNSNKEEREETKMADVSRITLADIKTGNPQLYGEMKADIIASMEADANQKTIMTKAGEMDTLTSQLGGNPSEMFKQYQTIAGEMAEAVGIAPKQGSPMPTMAEIGAKVKEVAGNLSKLTSIINPAKDQTAEAKATELVQQNQLAQNTKAVQDANAKFADLTKGITNEAVKNLVAMNFSSILQAKPESLPENYAQTSIQTLEAQVPDAIKSVVENAQTLMQNGQQSGEMELFQNLGVGAGAGTKPSKPVEQMSDDEFARHLGYFE